MARTLIAVALVMLAACTPPLAPVVESLVECTLYLRDGVVVSECHDEPVEMFVDCTLSLGRDGVVVSECVNY